MGKREDKGSNVVYRNEKAGNTHVWHKNSAGCTTKEGHRVVNHKSGNVSDHYGKTIHKKR